MPIDAFMPVLKESPVLPVTTEQKNYIRRVLDLTSSDSRFAQKAWDAISYILTSGITAVPSITSLTPDSAQLGSPSFTLSVKGANFALGSVILWNGSPEPTTYIGRSELQTIVNMETAQVAIDIPVMVTNPVGTYSNIMTFSLTEVAALAGKIKDSNEPHVTKK